MPVTKIPMYMLLWHGKNVILPRDTVPTLGGATYIGTDPEGKLWFWAGPNDLRSLTEDDLARFDLKLKLDPGRGYI